MNTALTVEDRLAKLDSINSDNVGEQKISALYKGPPGSGKTFNALTYPQPIRGIYSDVNLLTLVNKIKGGEDIDLITPNTWAEFEDIFAPAVENRLVKAETIVIDTIDFLSRMMWSEIQGEKPRLTIPDFGIGLNKMMKTMRQLTRATQAIPGKRNYNIIVNSHLRDVFDESLVQGKVIKTLVKTVPAPMGAFSEIVESFFDYVFLCESMIVSEVKTVDGRNMSVQRAKYQVRTVPPNTKHTCKGPGLPSVLGGTYPEIVKALSE